MKKGLTVILAAGDFPQRGGAAWKLLASAARVVACDSAANAYHRHFRKWPSVVVGDLDSFRPPRTVLKGYSQSEVVHVTDQDTNDLEKAMILCRRRGWAEPIIVGATGKREDHTFGNVFRALDGGCEVVTDFGRFIPFAGTKVLRVKKGAAVSIFAPDPRTRMTSVGLQWPLDEVIFRNLYCATLNRATATMVVLRSSHLVCVYL